MSHSPADRTRARRKPTTNQFRISPFEVNEARPRPSDSMAAIEKMIVAKDLSVVFQPIVRLHPVRPFAYEALVRCRVPAFRSPPDLFSRAVADHCTGLLGRMIREIAVPMCAGVPLFLNIHPNELQEKWLVRPDDPLFYHDHTVYLEVTETVPLTHFQLCNDVLREVRSRGNVHLVVDDLGAGYSNLKHIADLSPRIVKLDRGLVVGVDTSDRQRRLVAAIVRLCVELGAEVVAEGIETVAEFNALSDTGIHYAQGYLFARPAFPLPEISPEARCL